MGKRNAFAKVSIAPSDLMAEYPAYFSSERDAREFLGHYEGEIKDRLLNELWSVVDVYLREQWKPAKK